ncbi:hypothetical protein L596_014993 [Steinernema carpocapsae]|uniref:MD-2-related lipid-recognition domain-containing protein n=1 Tax=Steinernema carpocapsae TaxID=34508 RepID=A0A4U5NEK5_STECR|nr:hypothetical protein L596_014993 [Steinernema carpocapsae]
MGFGYVLSRCALLFFFLLSAVDAGSFASLQRYQDTDSYLRKPFLDQVTSDCTMEPNGTAFRPHFFSCNTIGKRRPFLVLNDAAVTNSTGDETFPVDFGQTVRFFFDVTSLSRKRRFDNMRVEIELYKRNRENLCEDNSSCPIRPGRQVVELAIEPSHMLSQALRMMIHDEAVPYQLAIRIKNRQRPAADLLCVNYLMRIRI